MHRCFLLGFIYPPQAEPKDIFSTSGEGGFGQESVKNILRFATLFFYGSRPLKQCLNTVSTPAPEGTPGFAFRIPLSSHKT
jgi:hypothetical protein